MTNFEYSAPPGTLGQPNSQISSPGKSADSSETQPSIIPDTDDPDEVINAPETDPDAETSMTSDSLNKTATPADTPARSARTVKSVNSLADLHSLFSDTLSDEQDEETDENHTPYTDYFKNTYDLVALMMYLTGTGKNFIETHEPDIMPIFESCQANRDARIIRNLCMIRTSLLRNYKNILQQFRYDLKNLNSLPEYIPGEAVTELEAEGIYLQKPRPDIYEYIIAINQEIANRINNVRDLFPEWINWDYVRPIFLMPNGYRLEGVKAARKAYSARSRDLPYQCYINWSADISGNLFYHDYKFVTSLYAMHGEPFENTSLVRDAGDILIGDLYEFISGHSKILIVVDCENSNPVKLAAALESLSGDQREHIHKVMLFDSAHTTAAWTTLCNTGITKEFTMERIIVERLYEHKSQVDMTLAANTCREIYVNGVDSVILISSDSDYWALIQALPGTDFLVMLEREKSGKTIRTALDSQGIVHCYIDDFCTASSYAIKTKTILNTLQQQFDEIVHFNTRQMLDDVLKSTWLDLSEREKTIFYDHYLKKMRLTIDMEGNARLVMGS